MKRAGLWAGFALAAALLVLWLANLARKSTPAARTSEQASSVGATSDAQLSDVPLLHAADESTPSAELAEPELRGARPQPPPHRQGEPGFELSGRVVDGLGEPVAYAHVDVRGGEPTVSWDDGVFAFVGLARGRWELQAKTEDGDISLPVLVDVPSEEPVTLVLPTRCGSISGTVVSWDGKPAVDVQLHLSHGRGFFDWSGGPKTRTDSHGHFLIERVREGEVQLIARSLHDSSDPLELTLAKLESRDVRLELVRSGRVEGTVDPSAGAVAGRQIELHYPTRPGLQTFESDATGRFSIEDLHPGDFWIVLKEDPDVHMEGGRLVQSYANTTRLSERITVASGKTSRVTFVDRKR